MPPVDGVVRRLGLPGRIWRSSIAFRVVATMLIAALIILAAAAWLILVQASRGILAGKQASVTAEASTALDRMQLSLTDTDLSVASLNERLNQLVDQATVSSQQFQVMIETPVTGFISRGLSADSVPSALADKLAGSNYLWVAPTLVSYRDGTPSVPGFAVGGNLRVPSGDLYPVYFLFPLTQEANTLAVLQRAVWSSMAVLAVALVLIAYLVARQISRPVRQASAVAQRIAAGDFEQRLPVVGTDELASLAVSMNDMAATLSDQIGQLEELSRVQQQFVSDVSHELRTPLTTVRMASDMLYDQRQDVTPGLTRTVELMHDEVDRFEELLTDLLEISRFDAGAATLSADDIDMADLVREEVADVTSLAMQADVQINVDVLPGVMTVEADPRRVRRILRNLLFNAIEHGEARPVDVKVAGDDNSVAVTVRDHGVGMKPEQTDLVFHRFWRADPSRQRNLGGTGLGLPIALEDARLHNGWLEAWGQLGGGASFRLVLPRSPGTTIESAPLPLRPDDAAPGPGTAVEVPEDEGEDDAKA